MMHQRGRGRAAAFWWRAAEPIPARPGRLDLTAGHEAEDHPVTAARPIAVAAAAPVTVTKVATANEASATTRAARASKWLTSSDLGGYRPASDTSGQPVVSPEPNAPAVATNVEDVAEQRPAGSTTRAFWRARVRPTTHAHRTRSGFRARRAMLAAGVVGAVAFAATTGFGRHMRSVDTLTAQVDHVMIAAGLGINEISVSGHEHTTDREIFKAVAASGASLLSLDVRAARRRIEALSWVEQATVSRILPDKLKIEVRERRASAVWLDGETTALVDASGRVLATVGTFVPPDLPRIAGPGAPEAAAEFLTAIAALPALRDRVHVARRIGQRRWDLELTNGTRIRLAAESASTALARLQALDRQTGVLDRDGQLVDLTSRRHAVSRAGSTGRSERRSAASLRTQHPL